MLMERGATAAVNGGRRQTAMVRSQNTSFQRTYSGGAICNMHPFPLQGLTGHDLRKSCTAVRRTKRNETSCQNA